MHYQFSNHFRLLAFAGAGKTWYSIAGIKSEQEVTNGDIGIRYMLARKFGLDAGMDIAHSGEDTAI